MGSSVSHNSNTKVIQTALQKQDTPKVKNKEFINTVPSSSHQHQKSDRTNTSPSSSNITNVANYDKDVRTKKNKKEENIEIEETMTDDEVERREAVKSLRETAMEVVALETRHEKDGAFVPEIRNAALMFYQSLFALTTKEKRDQFDRDIAQLMIETRYFSLSCEIVMYTYKNGWLFEDGNVNDMKYIPLICSMSYFHNLSDACEAFAIALANEPGFLVTIRQMLKDFLQKHFAKGEASKKEEIEDSLLTNALGIVHNMSMRESNVSKLRDAAMITCLKPYLNSPNDLNAISALASLAGIINEEECDIIDSNKHSVELLLNLIRKGLKDKMRRSEGWSCKECSFTVKMLTRNDANMKTLVELGALELLVDVGRTGDEEEQYECVSALWALSFDKLNQSLITGMPELGVVDLLVDLKSSVNEKIKKACKGALWTLKDALKTTDVEKYRVIGEQFGTDKKETQEGKTNLVTSGDKVSNQGHVMISYQWADQEVLKKVRQKIIERGYKVWMDIDQMGGSTLQAMADAVEGAAVVLICMSNKYKHSPNCRAEADYAFELHKPVIPLKMERGYIADGWLGILVAAKLFFEFSPKYPFEDKMKALLKEIDSVLGRSWDMPDSGEKIEPQIASVNGGVSAYSISQTDTASPVITSVARIPISNATFESVSKWTADDVKRWIEINGLQKCRVSCLSGGEIAVLACMRLECPEFFYKCLQDMFKIQDFSTISKVVLALHKLS